VGYKQKFLLGLQKKSSLKRQQQSCKALLFLMHGCPPSSAAAHLTISHMLRPTPVPTKSLNRMLSSGIMKKALQNNHKC